MVEHMIDFGLSVVEMSERSLVRREMIDLMLIAGLFFVADA
jgi:hypothetical protein